MKKLILLFIAIAFSRMTQGQVCVVDLSSQAAVDQFIIDNPTCTIIDGNVTLGFSFGDPLLNVDGLQNITEITGQLSIYGSIGSDLQGLSNLTSVSVLSLQGHLSGAQLAPLSSIQNVGNIILDAYYIEDLHVFDNITNLESLSIDFQASLEQLPPPSFYDVFPSLETITTNLTIGLYENAACDTLTGFNALTSAGSLNIGSTDDYGFNTTTFNGFHNLQTIEGTLFIGLWYLTDISGFESLQSVEDIQAWSWTCDCDLPDFESLTSLTTSMLFCYAWSSPDFPLLTSINGDFILNGYVDEVGCSALENVGGNFSFGMSASTGFASPVIQLQSLDSVGGDFHIEYSSLDNLYFLSGLEYVGGIFQISNNQSLTTCDILYLCENLPIDPISFNISGNSPGCNNAEEVLATCGNTYVEGEVFYDLDCDGIFNNADFYLHNPIIVNEVNVPVSSSDYNGHYFVPLQDNATTTLSVSGLPGFSTLPQTITTTATTTTYNDIHFALCPQADLHNVSISIQTTPSFRPGFGQYQFLTIWNNGPQPEDVVMNYELTNMPGVTAQVISDGGVLSANTITWNLTTVPAFGHASTELYLMLDTQIPIGQILTSTASVNFVSAQNVDIFPTNNTLINTEVVVGSYDPNDITVNIPAYNHELLANGEARSLDYTIRFQNTGTAEAINIRVLDDIEQDLEISSFEMIGSSHPCTLTFNENNQVEWLFENIMLPDSTSNEEESHGYIQYRIKTQPNLLLDDVIENTAAIYFDFNEPVITNTATTVFYVCPEELIIDSEPTVCAGASVNAIATYGWDDYSWSVNDIQNGNGLGISLDNLTSGIYSIVCNANTEYCEASSYFELMVLETPETPIISQVGNTLTATGSGIFEWTLNGETLIDGENSIEINSTGNYAVSVTSNGCTSETTSGEFVYIGIEESKTKIAVSIVPNPMTESCNVILENVPLPNTSLHVINALGELVAQINVVSKITSLSHLELNSGVYFISIQQDGELMVPTLKLVVKK
jgi:hypothetical protein